MRRGYLRRSPRRGDPPTSARPGAVEVRARPLRPPTRHQSSGVPVAVDPSVRRSTAAVQPPAAPPSPAPRARRAARTARPGRRRGTSAAAPGPAATSSASPVTPVSTSSESTPAVVRALDVGVQPVSDHQRALAAAPGAPSRRAAAAAACRPRPARRRVNRAQHLHQHAVPGRRAVGRRDRQVGVAGHPRQPVADPHRGPHHVAPQHVGAVPGHHRRRAVVGDRRPARVPPRAAPPRAPRRPGRDHARAGPEPSSSTRAAAWAEVTTSAGSASTPSSRRCSATASGGREALLVTKARCMPGHGPRRGARARPAPRPPDVDDAVEVEHHQVVAPVERLGRAPSDRSPPPTHCSLTAVTLRCSDGRGAAVTPPYVAAAVPPGALPGHDVRPAASATPPRPAPSPGPTGTSPPGWRSGGARAPAPRPGTRALPARVHRRRGHRPRPGRRPGLSHRASGPEDRVVLPHEGIHPSRPTSWRTG